MTREEIERVTGVMHLLKSQGLPCWYAVLGDAILDMPEVEARAIFSDATSYIVQAQRRAGYPQHWMRVLESTGGLHANIIFPAPPEVAARFKRSDFGVYCQGSGFQQIGATTKGWRRLASYLSGERTPQANRGVGHLLGPRVQGAHYLGEGGGDRVRLSAALYDDALRLGLIEPYQRTKSKPLPRVTPSARLLIGSQPETPMTVVSEANDAGAPAEGSGAVIAVRPAITVEAGVEGPRDERGQEPQGGCPACPVEPEQLPLFAVLPWAPPPFREGAEVRELRQSTGLSQERFAGRLGIRSQSHIANVERGHDRLSPQRRRLLRHIVETRLAA